MGNAISLPSQSTLEPKVVNQILAQKGRAPSQWELVPADRLVQIIDALDDAALVANMEQAKKAATVMLGSYPRHAIDDPEIYTRGIVSVLAKFPNHVGCEAVNRLTLTCKFMPTRAELNQQCEALMGELNAARAIARRMVTEGQRREQDRRDEAQRAESRRKFRDKHGDLSPMDVLKAEGITIGETQNKE